MSVLPTDIFTYGALSMPGYDGATTLNGTIGSAIATTMTVVSALSFPQTGEFAVQVDSEIMWVTQGAGSVNWTMIRGMGGTTAATHSSGANVTSVSGGPVDFLTGVAFTDITSGDTVDIISSSTLDVKQIISVAGRDVPGNFQPNKTGTLNGQTAVTGIGSGQLFDRLLFVGLGSGTTVSTTALTAAATSMTVASAANFPASGNYNIQIGKEILTVTAGQGTTTWTVTRGVQGTVATTHAIGDSIYLLPFGDVAVYDHTPVISAHTMQTGSLQSTGTTPALAKLQLNDGGNVAIGQIIIVTNNSPAGVQSMIRTITAITGYGTDLVAVDRDWDTIPTSATTYNVVRGWKLPFKTGNGVGATVPNQITGIQRALWGAAADVPGGSQRIFYEKVFAVNNNTATALTSAQVEIFSNTPALPGSALLDIALTKGLNDSSAGGGSAVNRQTLPTNADASALVFVTQPAFVSVIASPGSLPNGAAPNAAGAQGIWLRVTLPAGTAAYKGSADLRTQGNTI